MERSGRHTGDRTNRNAEPQKQRGEHQKSFAKERHGIFGKEICLVKNKQHKTAQKGKKRLNPAKKGIISFFFN